MPRATLTRLLLSLVAGLAATGIAQAESEAAKMEADATPPPPTAEALARALLLETNRVRSAHQRRPLRPREELAAAADDQAAYMALRMRTEHGSLLPKQANVAERVRRHGLFDLDVAENVASTSLATAPGACTAEDIAARLVAQWMESPGHRATLLDPRLTHFGGSIRFARLGQHWAAYGAQVFLAAPPRSGRFSGM